MIDNTKSLIGLRYYTLKEVGEIVGRNRTTLFRYIKQGKLKAVKIGQGWRVSEEDLREFLKGTD